MVPMVPMSGSILSDVFLNSAREINRDLYSSMESFVCRERIDRYKGGKSGAKYRDTITARVSLENGNEEYSELRRERGKLRDLSQLHGAWSKGEFGTLLKQTEQLLATQRATLAGEERLVDGSRAAIYEFGVRAVESPWDLVVREHHYAIPFRTRVWISEASSQIVRIQRTANEIPEALGIAEMRWSVSLNLSDLNGKKWLLPDTAEYDLIYSDAGGEEWNTMKFFDYHRYSAETSLRFN